MKRKKWKLAVIIVALAMTGCGSKNTNAKVTAPVEESSYTAGTTEEVWESSNLESSADSSVTIPQEGVVNNRKLIRTVNIDAETTSYDSLLESVRGRITELGGYIENISENTNRWSEEQTRYASLTVRVPKNRADELIEMVDGSSNVMFRSENLEDVTLTYVDLESHRKALYTEEERLLALMEEANSVEDLISIESRLAEVRYEKESIESQLRTFDNQIDYTTIYLNINEVARVTPVVQGGFFARVATGFVESVHGVGDAFVGIAEWFFIYLPYIVVVAVIGTGLWFGGIRKLIDKIFRKNRKN